MGDFNDWDIYSHPLAMRKDDSGIFEGFITGVKHGTRYKYYISARGQDFQVERGDPFAMHWELPPNTASVVWDVQQTWDDDNWMATAACFRL